MSSEANSAKKFQSVHREGEAPAEPQLLQVRQEPHPPVDAEHLQGRKRPAHGVHISATKPTIVYLTVCCDKRRQWLATDRHHSLLLDIWRDTTHWVVGQYVLMPDHLHLFAAPQESAVEVDAWVRYWKSQFTKRNRNVSCVWQTDHWDTRIRSLTHYEERSQYMFDNPVRASLVSDPELWPFKGVVHELRWE